MGDPAQRPTSSERAPWTRASLLRHALLLVALAGALRATYLFQYMRLPFLQAPLYDSVVYLHQAQAVHAGRLGDPSLLALSPLYGYFLAATGGAQSLVTPVLAQLLMGSLLGATVFVVGARREGALAAWTSGLLLSGYGLLLHYESKLLTETLGLCLCFAAAMLFVSESFRRGRLTTALGVGLAVGLAILARASLIFSPPFFLLASLLPWARSTEAEPARVRVRRTAGLALGLALVLGGNGLHNWHNTGFFVPVIMVSRTASVAVSTPVQGDLSAFSSDASGDVSPWDVVRQAEERIRRGPGPHPADAAAAAPRFDVAAYLSTAPDKLWRTFSDLELTVYQYGYYGERIEIPVLGLLPVTFGMLLLLGAVGAVVRARERGWRALLPYLPWFLGPLVTTSIFHPDSRYRLAMIVPLVWLGGVGVQGLARIGRRDARLAAAGAVAIACAALAARTVTYELHQPALWELSVAESAAKLGDANEVARRIALARHHAKDDPKLEHRITYILRRLGDTHHPTNPR